VVVTGPWVDVDEPWVAVVVETWVAVVVETWAEVVVELEIKTIQRYTIACKS
jgi:hypothetical protein